MSVKAWSAASLVVGGGAVRPTDAAKFDSTLM
jgi:hypothetical protein